MGEAHTRRVDAAAIVIGVMLLVLAVVIFWDMSRLEISSTYGLGPKAMPIVVATGLALLAVCNLLMAFIGGLPASEPADPKAILLILGGLAVLIAMIGLGGGFIPATAILFAA